MSLHTSKVQNHNVSTSHFDTYPNSPCAHLFILIIFDAISHIYAVHTQRKVYHTMPLHTYTSNFTTSSTLQEILSNSPLIIYGIIMYIGHKHHSHILFYA